jgi:diguanylate cyclase (GGDEF)-like protein
MIWRLGGPSDLPTISIALSDQPSLDRLRQVLAELGVRTIDDRSDAVAGFPVVVPLTGGQSICLDLPQPALLSTLDPDAVGVAILDHLGFARRVWGLARDLEFFDERRSALDTELAALIEGAFRETPGALYLDGYRFYASGLNLGESFDVFVLVTDAHEEQYARRQASKTARSADVLRKIGKALTMNQTLQPLCVAAVHEIASAAELAAVLLWVREADDMPLKLIASVGANRHGTALVQELEPERGVTCIAELVAARREPFAIRSVHENIMTAELEAKFCYLKPGAVAVLPLSIGDRLIGVLELVGRDGDTAFGESRDLMATVAEHLSLALNSAIMFENVERLASFDPLTGIANHRSMQDFLHRRLAEAERNGTELGVVMIDVDHFRSFNEEEGHDAGDEVLCAVAEVLRTTVRPYDLPARYGGEEFTVVMPGVGRDAMLQVAERIRERIQELEYVTRSGRKRHITASFGCALYPATAKDPPALLKAADVALFRAKRAGRNRVVFYEGAFQEERGNPTVDLEALWNLLTHEEQANAERLAELIDPYTDHVCRELGLSKSQEQILAALILVAPAYREATRSDPRRLAEMEACPEFRTLLPSLGSLDERWDGKGRTGLGGQHIPLLGRILVVLLAFAEDRGATFFTDPGRYDPEIIATMAEFDDAA